jgi:hypothetical protein
MGGIAGLHAAWGAGSTFPFRDAATLADTVAGQAAVPNRLACNAVAGALVVAAALAADVPIGPRRLRLVGRIGVATVLAGRGALGLFGATEKVSPGSNSPRFRRMDRRYYTPLCFALAAATVTATPTEPQGQQPTA